MERDYCRSLKIVGDRLYVDKVAEVLDVIRSASPVGRALLREFDRRYIAPDTSAHRENIRRFPLAPPDYVYHPDYLVTRIVTTYGIDESEPDDVVGANVRGAPLRAWAGGT